MKREIDLEYSKIEYNLQYKNVKNINLRIKSDGTVNVSANNFVSQKVIEAFLTSKADFLLNTLKMYEERRKEDRKLYFEENELKGVVLALCEKAYPYFESKGIKYPKIKFRKMISRWGTCNVQKRILTFNINLMYAPHECVEYVVLHEFTHFLEANHSKNFYNELSKVCPNWKVSKNKLKEIYLR